MGKQKEGRKYPPFFLAAADILALDLREAVGEGEK